MVLYRPPPPTGKWGPGPETVDSSIVRFSYWPIGGAALLRLPWRLPFHITATGRPYSDLGLPTTKHERVLDLSTLSYKPPRADRILIRFRPQQNLKYFKELRSISYKKGIEFYLLGGDIKGFGSY